MADVYDYRQAVKDDIKTFIEDEYMDRLEDFQDYDEFRESLEERAWISDSVTGNASGSYTFSTWQAEENLCHNMDVLAEALADFGGEFDLDKGAEHYDVLIRCWMVSQVIDEAIEEAGIEEDDERFGKEDEKVYTEADAE